MHHRRATSLASTARMIRGDSARDDAELVALGIDENDEVAERITLAVADAGRPEFDAARGTLLEIADEHIEVNPVLDRLRLRNLLEGHRRGAI